MSNQQHARQQARADVCAWVAWHAAELAALGVPTVLALSVSAWFWALATVAGAGWAAHEIRQQRRVQSLRTAIEQQQLPTGETETTAGTQSRSTPAGETRENA